MLLTFTKTQFKDLIKQGIKQHTIRADKHNRWKVGNKIHFWIGNPRNTRGKNKPYQFGEGICSRVETIKMTFSIPEDWQIDEVKIGEDIILKTDDELNALAVNDGVVVCCFVKLFLVEFLCHVIKRRLISNTVCISNLIFCHHDSFQSNREKSH